MWLNKCWINTCMQEVRYKFGQCFQAVIYQQLIKYFLKIEGKKELFLRLNHNSSSLNSTLFFFNAMFVLIIYLHFITEHLFSWKHNLVLTPFHCLCQTGFQTYFLGIPLKLGKTGDWLTWGSHKLQHKMPTSSLWDLLQGQLSSWVKNNLWGSSSEPHSKYLLLLESLHC